jgi:hypothetical protein
MAQRDCQIECRGAPLGREATAQIAALATSSAILAAVASTGRPLGQRAGIAGAATGAALILGLVGAQYVARKRCEAVCEALNALTRGEEIIVGEWLRGSMRWFVDVLKDCEEHDFLCWALPKLAPYLNLEKDVAAGLGG